MAIATTTVMKLLFKKITLMMVMANVVKKKLQ